MFSGCPKNCNTEGTHSKYSPNIACQLGSTLTTTTVLNSKIGEVKNKTPNHDSYTTTQQFSKLTTEKC